MKRFKKKLSAIVVSIGVILSAGYGLYDYFLPQQTITLDTLPNYQGEPYVEINNNIPTFTDTSKLPTPYENYATLDAYGRCGPAEAILGLELMPTTERESIAHIKPAGWQTVRYDDLIKDKYLYNRCHLIAFMLAGENANKQNLITGTRYLNVEGMLPFETLVHDYIIETGNHVRYRVTPIYEGDELLCRGVLMEAMSIEDQRLSFNVFCFNVQPGIDINYQTGESQRSR